MKLHDWQIPGREFLTKRIPEMNYLPHACLGWDMGLGKTVIACDAAREIKAKSGLIISPFTVLDDWYSTMLEWEVCDESQLKIFQTTTDRATDIQEFLIVNYDKLTYPEIRKQLLERKFDFVAYDEIHYLKSFDSLRADVCWRGDAKKGVPSLSSRAFYKWGFTGTPIINDAMDLYPMVRHHAGHLIKEYDSREKFGNRYSYRYYNKHSKEYDYRGSANVKELRTRLAPYLMCRKAEDVFTEMPEVVTSEIFINIPFNDIGGDESDTPMASLRKAVGEAKTPHAVQFTRDRVKATGEKQLVFTYTRAVTEEICKQLKDLGAVKIYGGMSPSARRQAKQTFINDPECKVIVCQLNSVGTGTNGLQKVCYNMIFAEFDWTAGGYKQQIGRLKRLLQISDTVYVYLLIADGTLDLKIVKSRKRKTVSLEILTSKENDMSLEQAIADNTAAIKELIKALGAAPVGKPQTEASSPSESKSEKPVSSAKASQGSSTAKATASSADSTKSEATTSKPAGKATKAEEAKVTDEDIRLAVKEMVEVFGGPRENPDAVEAGKEILNGLKEEFGVEKFSEIKGKKRNEFIERLDAAKAEREAAEQDAAEAGKDEENDEDDYA